MPDLRSVDSRLAGLEDHLKNVRSRTSDDMLRRELSMALMELSDTRLALLAPAAGDKRTAMRVPLGGVLTGRTASGDAFDCGLHDISIGGALIETDLPLDKQQPVWLSLPSVAEEIESVVLGTVGDMTHLGFRKMSPEVELQLTKSIEGRFLHS